MKLPRRRQLWTILMYMAIALAVFAWIGSYRVFRKDSVVLRLGKLGNYREVIIPNGISDEAMKLFLPLAWFDGWITGEVVLFGRPIYSSIGHGYLPEAPDLSFPLLPPDSAHTEELPAGNPASNE